MQQQNTSHVHSLYLFLCEEQIMNHKSVSCTSQMKLRKDNFVLPPCFFFLFFSCFVLGSLLRSAEAYKNYTVGDSLGWYDSTEKSDVNYQKWASGKTFSLGDFLLFNTNTNHSVIQTYNLTTYKLCDSDDSSDKDTTQWSTADPSNTATRPITVPVPLLKEGPTYFFSGDYDGDQCRSGQHFQINVTHGQGLPKSLQNPSDESPGPVGPQSGDDDGESAPDTIVPSNFNHPKEEVDDQSDDDRSDSSASISLSSYVKILDWQLCRGLVVVLGPLFFF